MRSITNVRRPWPASLARLARRTLAVPMPAALLAIMPGFAAAGPVFGVMGGVNSARLHGDYGEATGEDYRVGGAFGVRARFELRPGVSFQPELWWVMKGGKADNSFTVTTGTTVETYTTHLVHSIPYLELPILLRLDLPVSGALTPYVSVGPAVAVRLQNRLDITPDPIEAVALASPGLQPATIFQGVGTFDRPDLADWDFGVLGGIGVAVTRGHVRFDAEVRYARGLVNLVTENVFYDRATTEVVSATVGIEVR